MSGASPAPAVPDVSVVIAARNAARWLGDQLDAVARAAVRYQGVVEVLVVDNGSQDATRAVVHRHPGVRLVVADDARSPSYARNAGVAQARAPLLLFCDADDVVEEGWIEALAARLAGCDAAGGALDHDRLNDARIRRWRPSNATGDGLPLGYGHMPFAPSSNLGIHRSVFERLGGFDERLARAADVDLCWRLQEAGFELCYEPRAVVAYRHRASVGETLAQAYRFGHAGAALCHKHGRRRPIGARLLDLARAAPGHLLRPGRRVDWLRKLSHDVGMLVGRLSRLAQP